MGGLAALLTQYDAAANVHRHAALQVREGEVYSSVAAIGGAENGKQRLVLIDRQQLPITESPAFGRKIPTDDFYFAQKWFRHVFSLLPQNRRFARFATEIFRTTRE